MSKQAIHPIALIKHNVIAFAWLLQSMELVMKLLSDDGLATPSSGKDAAESAAATKLRLNDIFAGRVTLAQLYGKLLAIPTATEHRRICMCI